MELDCFETCLETWRIVRPEGSCYYIITNDIDTVDFVHEDELEKYGIDIKTPDKED
jgi:hypothetical protein